MFQFPQQLCGFLRRHKRKLIFAGVLVGGVVSSVKYAQYKIQDWLSKEEKKYLDSLRKQQHFDRTQEHCFAIAKVVVTALQENILELLDSSKITSDIKSESVSSRKLELWNDLKITIFANLASCIYVATISAAILRVQLNHISAKVYSKMTETNENSASDEEIQRWYLALCHNFIAENSIAHVTKQMKAIALALTDSMPLQCRLGGGSLGSLLKSFHNRIKQHELLKLASKDSEGSCCMVDFFVPSQSSANSHGPYFDAKQMLLAELWDMLDSDDFMAVINSCVLSSFEKFANCISTEISAAKGFGPAAVDVIGGTRRSEDDVNSVPLAKLLPIINSKIEIVSSQSFIENVLNNDLLSQFCTNVYDSFVSNLPSL